MQTQQTRWAEARIRPARGEEDLGRAQAFLKTSRCKDIAEAHPEERGSTRLMEVDGEVVAALLFDPRPLEIRGESVRCARIVETGGEDGRQHFRTTGDRELFDLMVEELEGYLWARRYPICYAHGELALYAPKGFTPCFYHPRVSVGTAEALRAPSPYRVRHLKSDDIKVIPTLLRQRNRIFRPKVFAAGVPPFHHFCVEGPDQKLRGFFSLQVSPNSTFTPQVFIPELEVWDRRAIYTILYRCALEARKLGLETVHFALAPAHPFAEVCMEMGGRADVRAAAVDPALDEEMVYMVDPLRLLQALIPAMERGLRQSKYKDALRSIAVSDGEKIFSLEAKQGRVSVHAMVEPAGPILEIRSWELTQLLTGYRGVHELNCEIDLESRRFLNALLPKTWPYSLCDQDHWEAPAESRYPTEIAAQVQATRLPWAPSPEAGETATPA